MKKPINGRVWPRLFSYLRPEKKTLIAVLGLSFCAGILQLLVPRLIGFLLDSMLPGEVWDLRLLWALALCFIAAFGFGIWQGRGVAALSNRAAGRMREDAFNRLSRLPMSYFDKASHGDVTSRLTNDIQSVNEALQQVFQQLFSGLIILFGSLIFMFSIQAWVALVVLLITPLSFFVTSIIAKTSHRLFLAQSKRTGSLQAHAEEMIEGQKLLRAFAGEAESQRVFDECNQELFDVGQKAQFASSLTNPGTRFVNNVTYVLVGVIASSLAALGRLSIGDISAFLSFSLQFAKPLNEITAVLTQVQQGAAAAERIFALLDERAENPEKDIANLDLQEGSVRWDKVRFAYDPAKPLIEDLSLYVQAGQTAAVVGPTGAGKTTLVNLLMRFYDAQAGAIYMDEQNIYTVKRESVRDAYGMVLQDTWLFGGTVYDNIAYGREGASAAEVEAAARAAHAHNFILQLPQGYQTKLQDAGDRLSAGQKQLLTIARVMLSQPRLLILDEATSNIDTRTEQLVQKSFLSLMEGRTSFIIAHRLSTIRSADLILVMDKGSIIEMGTHDELLAAKGFYADLYDSQFAPT